MTPEELGRKQEQERANFYAASKKAFDELNNYDDMLWQAFSDKGIDMPDNITEHIREKRKKFEEEWSVDGALFQELQKKQKQERINYRRLEEFKLKHSFLSSNSFQKEKHL